jgi:hypothetical protein
MAETSRQKTCFVVTGLPRSGTSSVAQLLENLGVYFGDHAHFLDTSIHKHNPVFYELQWINDFNDKLIGAMGASYFEDFFPMESDFDLPAVKLLERILAQQFRSEFGGRGLVGIKDPRFCFTLPFWRRVLGSAGYEVKVILTMRNSAAVIKSNSLLREDRPCQWQRFYARHLLAINYFARDLKMCQIDFDRLMKSPLPTAGKAAECLGLANPDPARATGHLKSEHYHNRPTKTGTGDAWVDQIDLELRNEKLDPEQYLKFRAIAMLYAEDRKAVTDVERKLADKRIENALIEKDAHIAKLEDAYRKLAKEMQQAQRLLSSSPGRQILKLKGQLEKGDERNRDLQDQLQILQKSKVGRDQQVANLEKLLRQAQEELEPAKHLIGEFRKLVEGKDHHIVKLEALVHESAQIVYGAEGAAALKDRQIEKLQTELNRLQGELSQHQAEFESLRDKPVVS